ncbi:efflux RND transporter periplasmic adaptor subunit [Pseudanabaena sp. FACHB-2040]|nr:efflux RND transporter periplasmic adaptor subunit [Pseudanabaena sp. FACHB-2040]MBD2256916.1 efflux RND transporter periplasmic adaptor subunit [Pseudanabaena sp. FACHB-2040]
MAANQSRPWKRPGLWALIGALLVVGGISFVTVRNVLQSRQEARELEALPPPQQVQVAALGRLEPQGRVVDVAAPEMGRLGEIQVKEGDLVETGQILAYMDTYEIRQAERDYAASQLEEARTQLAAERQRGTSRVQEANTRITQVDPPQQAGIAAQEAAIDSLQAQLDVAEIDLTRFQRLSESGALSRQELDRQQATVERLRADLQNARATRDRLVREREGNLSNAQAQVQSAQAENRLAEVATRVQSAEQNLALAQAQLDRTVIKAPQAGQVLDIYVEPGEAVSPAETPILALGNTTQMYVVAEVYETDIGLVRAGQPVTITSRNGAFDQVLTGTVERVGLQIFKNDILDDDPAANADARVVEVWVRVDQSEVVAGLTNLQVDVAIDIERAAIAP